MTSLQAVKRGEIQVGQPLPYSVYDAQGTLLLCRGHLVNSPHQLEVLLRVGVFFSAEEMRAPRSAPPLLGTLDAGGRDTFEEVDRLKLRLRRLFGHLLRGTLEDDFTTHIDFLVYAVQDVCANSADAALANLALDYEELYAVVHALQAAVLCNLVSKRAGLDKLTHHALLRAALTHDLGLLDVQEDLEQCTGKLSDALFDRVRAHPQASVEILQRMNVDDPLWLEIVAHHHERLDGSGYPDHLKAESIQTPTRLMAAVDVYSAMVRDRPYRKAKMSAAVLRELLLEGTQLDTSLIHTIVKEVGAYPPGAIVRLKSGQIAVVKERHFDGLHPIVYAFVRPDGLPLPHQVRLDTTKREHAIAAMVPFSDYRNCVALIRNVWIGQGA